MIELYTDGACVPNPGEMAIGGVLFYKGKLKEFSGKIGKGTNNIAELTAIEYGLGMIKDRSIPVTVISDSQYAINSLNGKWKPKKNQDLINAIKLLIKDFESVNFKWVRGHNGNKFNERADELANRLLPDWIFS